MKKITIETLLNWKELKDLEINEYQRVELIKLLNNFDINLLRKKKDILANWINYGVNGDWTERLKKLILLKNDSMSLEANILRYGEEEGKKRKAKHNKSVGLNKKNFIKKHGIKKWNEHTKKITRKTKDEYIKIYGEEEGLKKWNHYYINWKRGIEKKKESGWKNGLTQEEYIDRYGYTEGLKKWNIKNKKISKRQVKKYYIEKYGEEEGLKKWNDRYKYFNTKLSTQIELYGKEEGTKRYKMFIERMAYSNTIDYYIDKYGNELGEIYYTEYIIKCTKRNKLYSKISQKLFWMIYHNLTNNEKMKCYFGELNEEYVFYVNTTDIKIMYVDFKLEDKIIEFDGTYWHSLEESKINDKIRDNYLQSKNYKILRIKEQDFVDNNTAVVEKCLLFLREN